MAHSIPPSAKSVKLVELDDVSQTSRQSQTPNGSRSSTPRSDNQPSRKISQISNTSKNSSPQRTRSNPNSRMDSSDNFNSTKTTIPTSTPSTKQKLSPSKSHIVKVGEMPADSTYGSLSKAQNSSQNGKNANDNKQLTEAETGMKTKKRASVEDKPYSDEQGNQKRSDIAGDMCRAFGVFFAIGVRAVLLGFCLFTIWFVVYRKENHQFYWLLALPFGLLVPETFNIVISRAGQERKWVCLCFLCYLMSVIPCIWILELDRLETFQSALKTNITAVSVNVAGVTADIKLDPSTTLAVTEQCLLFLLILGRWLLPRGDITRDQLSQLLFVYIGMASDVMELFQLFDEAKVRTDRILTYLVLFVWSLSLLQFTLVLTMSRSPKKVRTAVDMAEDETEKQKVRSKQGLKDNAFILLLTQSELWSLCVSIFMQDGPFLAIRLFTIIKYSLINYTIIFFTCKNILVILLLLYRVLILFLQNLEKNDDDDDDVVNDNDDDSTILHKGSRGRDRNKTESTNLSVSDIGNRASSESSPQRQQTGKRDGIRSRNANQVSPSKH